MYRKKKKQNHGNETNLLKFHCFHFIYYFFSAHGHHDANSIASIGDFHTRNYFFFILHKNDPFEKCIFLFAILKSDDCEIIEISQSTFLFFILNCSNASDFFIIYNFWKELIFFYIIYFAFCVETINEIKTTLPIQNEKK